MRSFSSKVRRVVITGIGLVTPLGLNVRSTWDSIISGKSGVRTISNIDTSKLLCKIAGTVEDFDSAKYFGPNAERKMDKFIRLGVIAASEAIDDSGWKPDDEEDLFRTGVMIGSGIGGLRTIEKTSVEFHRDNQRVSPFFIPAALINLLSGAVAIKYGFAGPNSSVATACSSGAHAIGDAARIISYGDADVMIAGGSEAPITEIGVAGFVAARALTTQFNDSPTEASRPWDLNRSGFVMGEGAGILVLEEYEHAKARGAKIYAEIIGYGLTGDAYHITAPHPEGSGGRRAMLNAISDAKITINDIDYINAHGTSTPIGDEIELNAVSKLFENHPRLTMSSTKSSIGHLLGAAGSVEAIFTVLAMINSIVPPTINLHNPMETKIDLVPFVAKEHKIKYAMSNSFGFGGTNSSLVFKKI